MINHTKERKSTKNEDEIRLIPIEHAGSFVKITCFSYICYVPLKENPYQIQDN